MSIWSGKFWKATAERAIATAAQTAIPLVTGDYVNAFEMDFGEIAGVALGGALLSLLKSLGTNAVKGDGPGLTDAETLRST